jgi:anti-sigma factor RsiW
MKCQITTKELSRYLDGELGLREKSRIERHLASCPGCGQILAELKRAWDLLELLPRAAPAPYLAARILAKAAKPAGFFADGWFRRLVFPVTTAMATAVGLWLGSLAGRNGETAASGQADEIAVLSYVDHLADMPSASLSYAYFNADAQE